MLFEGSSESPFSTPNLLGFLGSDRLQGSVTCSQIEVDVFLLPQICFAKG